MFTRNFILSTLLAVTLTQATPLSDNTTVKTVSEAVKTDKLSIGEREKRYTIYAGASLFGSNFNFSNQNGDQIFAKLRLVRDKLAPDSTGGANTKKAIDAVLDKYKASDFSDVNVRNALTEDLNYIAEGFANAQ